MTLRYLEPVFGFESQEVPPIFWRKRHRETVYSLKGRVTADEVFMGLVMYVSSLAALAWMPSHSASRWHPFSV